MKIIVNKKVLIVCFVLLIFSNLSYAGFFDDLKSKVEKSVSDTTDDVVRSVTGDSKKKEKEKRQAERQKKRAEAAEASKRATQQHEDEHERHKIRKAQKGLTQLGYYSGDLTGTLDSSTRKAVEKYQKDKKLKADGKLSDYMYGHISCSVGDQRGCNYVKNSPIEREKQLALAKQQAAEKQKRFDAYSGPVTLGHNERELMKVRFNKQAYKLKNKNGSRNSMLTNLLRSKYPKEWISIKTEFDMHRELPKLHKRLMDEANNASTTYREVFKVGLGQYDFDRKSFLIGIPGSRLVTLNRGASGEVFLSMNMDKAEQFKNDTRSGIFIEKIFQVVDVSKDQFQFVLAQIERIKVYKNGVSMSGKETLLSDLIMDIPVSKLDSNQAYSTQGGPSVLSGSGKDSNSIQINF